MNAGLIILRVASAFFASRPRDATRRMRMSATELTSALRRRSGNSVASVTVTPSQQ